MRSRTALLLALKGLVSAGLLGFILAQSTTGAVYARLAAGQWSFIALAFGLIVLNIPLVSVRWWLLVPSSTGAGKFSLGVALRATWIGLFLSQILPGAVGGDAVRAWFAYRGGLRPGFVVASVVVDRLSALLALLALAVVSLLSFRGSAVGDFELSATLAASLVLGAAALGIAVAPMALQPIARRWSKLRKMLDLAVMVRNGILSWRGAAALVVSILVHVLTTFAVTLTAQALYIPVHLSQALQVVPLSLLISAIPVTVAGWGIREAGMVLGFAAFGIPAQDAAILSVWLGLSLLFSSLPGGLLWLKSRKSG